MWVEPHLICEVKYTERTTDGLMRHPSYQGLREDKKAAQINIEETLPEGTSKQTGKKKASAIKLSDNKQQTAIITQDSHQVTLTNLRKVY